MQMDPASKKLIHLRVFEIVQQSLSEEKEQFIETLAWQYQ